MWGGGSKGRRKSTFSQIDEGGELQPFGHGVSVHGGGGEAGLDEGGDVEVPRHGINIKTEIEVRTSSRLDYNDRLY